MKTKPIVIALALLAGCSFLPEGHEPLPAEDYRTAFAVWLELGYPPGRCNEYMAEGDVLLVVVDDTWELCHGDVNGCMTSTDSGVFGSGGWYPLIVMRREAESVRLLGHELTHWFARCSRFMGGGDAAHGNERLWGEGGVAEVFAEVLEGGVYAESRRSP